MEEEEEEEEEEMETGMMMMTVVVVFSRVSVCRRVLASRWPYPTGLI